MFKKRKRSIIFVLAFFLFLFGCSNENENVEELTDDGENTTPQAVEQSDQLVEDRRIYKYDEENEVVHLYVTILPVNENRDDSLTFFDMNRWYDFNSNKTASPKLEVIFQEGDKEGPKKGNFGYEADQANAIIKIRGNSSRYEIQKSYKIKLYDQTGLWSGQKSLNLNKHMDDLTRVRNKLSFDYFKMIPNMTSLRTQFVNLHIKDLTANPLGTAFEDYGLYTHVEQANERFLASHGLHPYGNLYKAQSFEFFRYPDQLKLEDDPSYDNDLFEAVLEVKGSKDHAKLLEMLEDINDYSLNFEQVFEQYFDRENYLTWIAVNILFGNEDTMTQNFYLYSPLNSNKWYFLPWDYDGAWGWNEENGRTDRPAWQSGLGRYWGTVLHKRFFKNPVNVEALNKQLEELMTIVTPEQTKQFLDSYYDVVYPFVSESPDLNYLPIEIESFKENYYSLIDFPEKALQIYQKQLENPMPFFQSATKLDAGKYMFQWDVSYDLQGDDLSYTFQLSKDPQFTKMVNEQSDLAGTKVEVNILEAGQYFWKVIATDSKGNEQISFDKYVNSEEETFYGVKEVIVK